MFNRISTSRGGFLTISMLLALVTVMFVVSCGGSATATAVPQALAEPAVVPEEAAVAPEDKFRGDTLNVLIWLDWAIPELIEPFEEKYGVTVNVKEYEATPSAITLLNAEDPGFYDIIVVDTAGVNLFVANGYLEPLDISQFDTSDFYEPLMVDAVTSVDGVPYVVPGKFGYYGIGYNTEKVDLEDVQTYAAMWDPKFAGKTGTSNWSLVPIEALAQYLGYIDFENNTEAQMAEVMGLIQKMKDNDLKVVGTAAQLQQALANETVYLVLGAAEWTVSGLIQDGLPVDWVIPDEGATMWTEAIGIGAGSKNRELAKLMIEYYLTPEAQAILAINPVWWGMPANRATGELLSAEEKRILRWDDQDEYLASAVPYWQPPADVEGAWENSFFEIVTD